MKIRLSKLFSCLNYLLPASLTNRVFALYSLTLLVFVGGGLALFLKFNFQEQIEQTELASIMLVEVVAQAVQDSVIIGDYDTVSKTLNRGVQGSVFSSASFIDLSGGKIIAQRQAGNHGTVPLRLEAWVANQLDDINRPVTVGGKDYGILRLKFDAPAVAENLWSLTVFAISMGLLSLLGGLILIRVPIARWLGSLDRLRGLLESLGTGKLDAQTFDAKDQPTEIRQIVEMFNRTALLVREREASRRALDDQKFALDQHAIVSITDAEGVIMYANDSFCAISGYPREALIGNTHRIINSGTHPTKFFTELWLALGEGRVWRGEICNRKRSGELYWVDATVLPLRGEEGKNKQYIAIRTDITARKAAELATIQAKESAEKANRVKGDFLANMSHEIRTPMNGIIGMTELALDTELTHEQREYLSMVKTSANALLDIVNDILDFSKIEAGRMEIEKIAFSFEKMLSNAMKPLALLAHEKNLELLLHIAPDVPERLIGDPGRLRQVIVNLLSNAIKFTAQGEIEVSITRVPGTAPASTSVEVCFSVRDTGIGIPKEKFDAIFESFSQADTSTTRQYGGTGLGLTISAHLVSLMGGRIGLESKVGHGTTFHFNLHLPVVAPDAQASLRNTGRIAGMRALVVDDNATNRNVLLEILRNWKMEASAVASGEEALQELERTARAGQTYELALLDVRMPGMDGFALAEQLKQHPHHGNAMIMMLTSEGQRGDAARCREIGVTCYLMKPVSQPDLLNAIMSGLGVSLQQSASLITRHSLRESRRTLNLLLAEDNAINQALAVRLLEKLGHQVSIANNGLEAVQQWKAGTFDAILMDIDMPLMNGHEATRHIREQEQQQGNQAPIRIIAMTAHAMEGVREACQQQGMDDYIAKPIDTDALWRALDGLTQKAGNVLINEEAVAQNAEIVDFAKTREMIGDDREFFDELVRLFLRDVPQHMQQIRAGMSAGDHALVRSSAHTLKGMVGTFYFERASHAASELERAAMIAKLPADITELESAMRQLKAALRTCRW
jgi:two-component system sensor histidine kinase/response regulator